LGRPFYFALSPLACMFVSGTLTPAYGYSVIASSDSIWLHPWPFNPPSPSHWSPARTHCPHSQNALLPLMAFTRLSRLWCLVSSSGTYDLKGGKIRAKEKGDNGKSSSRKKRKTKKEGESHLQIHNYIIQHFSSWEMDLHSLHLTLLLPSVHSSPRWRVEMSTAPG